jgi:peptidoglycan/LPS O-acetylase OafA/YrhL
MPQLDSLRAIAVGLVMVEHFAGQTVNNYIPIGAGSLGVGGFFTLSGFLITGILLEAFDRNDGPALAVWKEFYARRILRLAPAFYLVLLALIALEVEPIASSWPWHASYLTNIWIALGNPSNVLWSLAVEEQFYLLWPFIIAFTPRQFLIPTTLGLIVIALLTKLMLVLFGMPLGPARGLLPLNLELLALGCLLAMACYRNGRANDFRWYRGRRIEIFTKIAMAAIVLAVVIWFVFGEKSLWRLFANNLLCAVFFAWLIASAAVGFTGMIGRVLNSPALQLIGQMSYGIYLVHSFVPDLLERYAGPMPKWQAAPIVLVITFGVCALSWFLIEKPILRWGRRLRTSRESGALPSAA